MAAGGMRSTIALVVGGLLALLALLADTIGIGRVPGFGWKQAITLVVGLALIGAGWFLRR